MMTTLGALNPLRYRGYVYDSETGLYYLQSRYYNPSWGRFINADGYISTGQGFVGNNMFAYCNNNPVNHADTEGTIANVIIGAAIGAVFGGINAAINGENILFGAVVGGLAGVASATVGLFVAGCKLGTAIVVSAVANGLIGAGSNVFNQYVNYRLQDKAKRENTGKGNTAVGQSQDVANKAYAADSFGDYFNLKEDQDTRNSFIFATLCSIGGGALGGWAAHGGSQSITIGLPSADDFQGAIFGAGISGGTTTLQILFDPIIKGETGGR